MIALTAKTLYTPLERVENPLLLLEGQHIAEVTSQAARQIPAGARVVDFGDAVLAPGFLDIHIHGGAGHDVMESNPAGLSAVEQLIAKHGVTGYFPTTVTAPIDQILSALERLATAIENSADGKQTKSGSLRATPLGIHLEGPFISHARPGVHPPKDLMLPTLPLFERFWQAARGHIRMMTIAPELNGAAEVIAEATKRGVCVSMGHSDADVEATRAGVAAGARHATHVFNAMRPLHHREPGIVGEVLTNLQLTTDVIADGVHLHPLIVQLILRAKGEENTVLITDAISATGMPDGRYPLGPFEVEVKDGKALYNGHLAGSILTLDVAVRNVMHFAHWDLRQAVRAATLNPAWVAGLPNRGQLRAGAPADLVVLSPCGEVRNTIIGGHLNDAASNRLGA
jgi:N-acetylglucosamine-6-phosphate deacetylase